MAAIKTIIVTGGASGLGRATCERFARGGFAVCVADINQQRGNETVAALKALGSVAYYQTCDVRKEQDIETTITSAVTRWGQVDVLVNNAGVAVGGRIETSTMDDWLWAVDINVLGVARGCKAITPLFKKQRSGHIVNIASMAGLVNPPLMACYNATKSAVVGLSETLRIELEPFGIHTSVVCPAFFQTNLAESFRSGDPGMKKVVDNLLASSHITADNVAEDIFNAVQNKRFYILSHKEGRRMWRIKRYFPGLLKSMVSKGYKKNLKKQGVEL